MMKLINWIKKYFEIKRKLPKIIKEVEEEWDRFVKEDEKLSEKND